jgi:hypothetical protein
MSTTTRISAVSGRLLMSSWPGQTGKPKSHQARGVSAVPPCLAPFRLQIRLRMWCSTGGFTSLKERARVKWLVYPFLWRFRAGHAVRAPQIASASADVSVLTNVVSFERSRSGDADASAARLLGLTGS